MFTPVDNRLQGADQLLAVAHHGQDPVPAGDPGAKQHVGDGLRGHVGMIRGIAQQGGGFVGQQLGASDDSRTGMVPLGSR